MCYWCVISYTRMCVCVWVCMGVRICRLHVYSMCSHTCSILRCLVKCTYHSSWCRDSLYRWKMLSKIPRNWKSFKMPADIGGVHWLTSPSLTEQISQFLHWVPVWLIAFQYNMFPFVALVNYAWEWLHYIRETGCAQLNCTWHDDFGRCCCFIWQVIHMDTTS